MSASWFLPIVCAGTNENCPQDLRKLQEMYQTINACMGGSRHNSAHMLFAELHILWCSCSFSIRALRQLGPEPSYPNDLSSLLQQDVGAVRRGLKGD